MTKPLIITTKGVEVYADDLVTFIHGEFPKGKIYQVKALEFTIQLQDIETKKFEPLGDYKSINGKLFHCEVVSLEK